MYHSNWVLLVAPYILTKAFETLIRNKLGNKADSIITPKVAAEINSKFDTIKRQFDNDDEGDSEYEIQLRNAPEMPHIGLEEGYLKIPRYKFTYTISHE